MQRGPDAQCANLFFLRTDVKILHAQDFLSGYIFLANVQTSVCMKAKYVFIMQS